MGKTALRGHTAAEQSGRAGLSGQRGPGAGSVVGIVELQSRKPGDRDCVSWSDLHMREWEENHGQVIGGCGGEARMWVGPRHGGEERGVGEGLPRSVRVGLCGWECRLGKELGLLCSPQKG